MRECPRYVSFLYQLMKDCGKAFVSSIAEGTKRILVVHEARLPTCRIRCFIPFFNMVSAPGQVQWTNTLVQTSRKFFVIGAGPVPAPVLGPDDLLTLEP